MPEQIQELISKIKTEGIEEAQKKAKVIEAQAQEQAQRIVAKAKEEANRLMAEANVNIQKSKEAAEKALQQAARDTLLNLRQDIQKTLKRITLENVGKALTPDELSAIIAHLIEKSFDKKSSAKDMRIILSDADCEKLKKGLVSKLQEKLKEEIRLQSSSEVTKGFLISFDGGKSAFDFTDESLTEFLSAYLNPEIAALLEDKMKK